MRLRFTGMCTGCHLRPLTTASTIRPALLSLDGVTAVEIEGSRISAEAEARLAAAFAQYASSFFFASTSMPISRANVSPRMFSRSRRVICG